jgi:membrane protein DedA with SNARE-associated domain
MGSLLSQLINWATSILETTGYVGIVFLIALENVFPPIPSEVILPLTGFLVNKGELNFIGALLASTLGSILGALCIYYLSQRLGKKRVLSFTKRFGAFIGISSSDLEKALGLFHKHGGKLVFFGRVVPTIRSVVSIPAGLAQMDLKKFILYTALGSALWNGTLIGVGWSLGDRWQEIQRYTKVLEYGVWILVLGGIAWLFWRKYHRK